MGLFDTPAIALDMLAEGQREQGIVFGLRTLPIAFEHGREIPLVPGEFGGAFANTIHDLTPAPIPSHWRCVGYDSCCRQYNDLDASPLSCNREALKHGVNEWGLFPTFEEGLAGSKTFGLEQPEDGPYLLLEVWTEPKGIFAPR